MARRSSHRPAPSLSGWLEWLLVGAGLCAAVAAMPATASAQEPAPDESRDQAEVLEGEAGEDIDYIELGAMLLRDGHYRRALRALQRVEESAEATELGRLYRLRALAHWRLGDLGKAVEVFRQAVAHVENASRIQLYLAQIYFKLERYEETIAAIEAAGAAAETKGGWYIMRAQSHWRLEQRGAAWEALRAGADRFAQDTRFTRRQIFYLIELGLYQRAVDIGLRYVARGNAEPEDFVAIGNALRNSHQYRQALRVLEKARLRFPDHEKLLLELGHVYIDQGRHLTAATLFRRAALSNRDLLAEASELYRRAGKPYRALSLNAQIPDEKKKLKQRIAMLLELERFDKALTMEDDLYRVGLLNNEDIRYALAYAYFKAGAYDGAERHLAKLTESDLFRKATQLREAMAQCRKSAWRCY